MGWLTSCPTGYQVSKVSISEKHWRYHFTNGWEYQARTTTTTVEQYDAMTLATANAAAAAMFYDDTDSYGEGTITTATVQRQNDADAHSVVKTTKVTGAWGAWT